jgi:hypothetical protein
MYKVLVNYHVLNATVHANKYFITIYYIIIQHYMSKVNKEYQQLATELHKPVSKKFQRGRRVTVAETHKMPDSSSSDTNTNSQTLNCCSGLGDRLTTIQPLYECIRNHFKPRRGTSRIDNYLYFIILIHLFILF